MDNRKFQITFNAPAPHPVRIFLDGKEVVKAATELEAFEQFDKLEQQQDGNTSSDGQ